MKAVLLVALFIGYFSLGDGSSISVLGWLCWEERLPLSGWLVEI